MVYRSLLVHLDDDERCGLRTELALALARRFEAHLVGLAPTGLPPLGQFVTLGALDQRLIDLAEAQMCEQARGRLDRFLERCTAAGHASSEALIDVADAADSLVHHGRISDLVIVGQADADAPGYLGAAERVGRVVLQGARPTLVVPCAGRFDRVGERVLVAWDDGREAARALGDALPMLARASEVHVLQIDRTGRGEPARRHDRLTALQRWLAWHGVEARVHLEASDLEAGELLLSRAADLGSDLLVMGAYGHARWTERVLGGATRTILASMTLPVLMSH